MKILIIEDDFILAKELVLLCERWGFESLCVEEFQEITTLYTAYRPDLVLMDINLPYYDGFYWCGKIRDISAVPVLFLSSRDQNADKIMAMSSGGDDYVEKPFDSEMLLVKIRSLLRRTYEYRINDREYLKEGMSYEPESGIFTCNQRQAELTNSERKIMNALTEHKGSVVSREKLMQVLWNSDEFVTDASLTVLISRLRTKLREVSEGEEVIQTKKGVGYYIA